MAKRTRLHKVVPFELANITPLTENQEYAFDSRKNLIMCGSAGSGKSFIACYLGIKAVLKGTYSSIALIRSAVPTRDIGFLPGTDKEKTRIYEEPYYGIFAELMQRGDAYDLLKLKDFIHFRTTSYLRGLTLRDCFVVVDECQNMSFHELDSLVTRLGENCRLVLCGDFKQSDLKNNGLKEFLEIVKSMPREFDTIEFTVEDIVRSDFVKEYIRAKERLGK